MNRKFNKVSVIPNNTVTYVINYLSNKIRELIQKEEPEYILALETKGAILLESTLEIPLRSSVLYPRALDYLPQSEFQKSWMIIDDTFFTGRTLRKNFEKIADRGAKRITLASFFDFSYLYSEKDIDTEIHKKTKFPNLDESFPKISHIDVLTHMQSKILSERMPPNFDHLVFEANISLEDYLSLFHSLGESNRLLYYGRRGSFYTSSILLDDLVEEALSTPAKIRFWYDENKKLLRVAPIAWPSKDYELPATASCKELYHILKSNNNQEDWMDVSSFLERIKLMRYLTENFKILNIKLHLQDKYFKRYYPGLVGERLVHFVKKEIASLPSCELPKRSKRPDVIEFMSVVPLIIGELRNAYEKQGPPSIPRKDLEPRGYTISELIKRFSNDYSVEQIHAGIDYSYDLLLTTSFKRTADNGKLERAVRTTEGGYWQKFLTAEAFGAGILFTSEKFGSGKRKVPVWVPNKVYSIIEHGLGSKLETLIATTHFFGDYTKIQITENTYKTWSTLRSSLWDKEVSHKGEGEDGTYLVPLENMKEEAKQLIISDPRLRAYQAQIDAIQHLCEQGDYIAAVLANILCDHYGGATYIAYNLEQMLEEGIDFSLQGMKDEKHPYYKNMKGLEKKLEGIEKADYYIGKLQRRATQLRYQTRLIAEEFSKGLKVLPQPNAIYNTARILFKRIKDIYELASQKKWENIIELYRELGVEFDAFNEKDFASPVRLLRWGQAQIVKWIYAISGKPLKKLDASVIESGESRESVWILAYDLVGERREIAQKVGIPLEEVNRNLHGLIENWIIANHGKVSKAKDTEGDKRYGFFKSESDAVKAVLWIDYHSRLLQQVNPCFSFQNGISGIGLAKGRIRADGRGGVEGEMMDCLGHQLKKDKLNEVAEKIGAREGNPPLWIVAPEDFPQTSNKKIIEEAKNFEGVWIAPIKNLLNHDSLPWIF